MAKKKKMITTQSLTGQRNEREQAESRGSALLSRSSSAIFECDAETRAAFRLRDGESSPRLNKGELLCCSCTVFATLLQICAFYYQSRVNYSLNLLLVQSSLPCPLTSCTTTFPSEDLARYSTYSGIIDRFPSLSIGGSARPSNARPR